MISNSLQRTQGPVDIADLAHPSKEIFKVAHFDSPQQVPPLALRKILFIVSSVLTVGLVPAVAYGLSKLVPKLVLPALLASDQEKRVLEEKQIFLSGNSQHCQEFDLQIDDGAIINGMTLFPSAKDKKSFQDKQASTQKWIIRFNGNGEFYERNLDGSILHANGVDANILVFNYRGVGESKCPPKRPEDLIADGEACVKYLLSKGVKEENILIHGLSLGGGVGSQVASLHEKIGLINERSFGLLSKEAAALVQVPIVEKLFLGLGWELDSVKAFEKITAKKLIVFHKQDAIMPYHQTSLYKVYKEHLKAKDPANVEEVLHKGQLKKRLKEHQKPLNVQMKERAFMYGEQEGLWAHNYPLDSDRAYPKVQQFMKDFFKKSAELI